MKRESRKVAKRILAFLMVLFLISINSFAAVVSDNDGSAFITKAEFDAIKAEFQGQIDSYNRSIDSKIDGAVAAYLAGIRIDDKKFYKVFGYDCGIWMGKKANNFYVFSLNNSPFHPSDSYASCFCIMDDIYGGKTNRGYGYGRFIKTVRLYPDPAWYPDHDEQAGLRMSAGYTSVTSMNYHYSMSASSRYGKIALTGSDQKEIYAQGVSDAFQTCINIFSPQFPLFEFYSAGEATIDLGWVQDGYLYEGGAHGGATGKGDKDATLYKVNSSGETQIMKFGTGHEKKWTSFTVDVNPGDQLILKGMIGAESYVNRYSIYFFGNQISGWEIQTT